MEYNLDLIQSAWKIMNSPTSSSDDKKQADVYLTEFKKSIHCLKISHELLLSSELNNKVFSSFMINQYIRDNITQLIESKEFFDKIKRYLFNDIIIQLENCHELIIQRICLATAIIVMIGSIKHWMNCIEELMQYAKGSYQQCYYTLVILSSITLDVSSIAITQKDTLMISDALKDKRHLIQDFILNVVTTIPLLENNSTMQKKFLLKTIEVVSTWIKFNLNILQMNSLCEMMLNQITEDSIKNISDMFSDSISQAKSAKIYSLAQTNDINEMINHCDKGELLSLSKVIGMIFNFIGNYTHNVGNIKKNDTEDTLLIGIANIFACICENYIFLFFAKDQMSQQLLQMLLWFISINKKKISYKFFETICEMREFVNNNYKMNSLTNEEKMEFAVYLMKITEAVMVNCKLKALDSNYNQLLKKDLLNINRTTSNTSNSSNYNITPNNNLSNNACQLQESQNDIEEDSNEICVIDYRRNADDVFYNIFIILVQNYPSEGAGIFLSKIQEILSIAKINNESILSDMNRLLAVETVFFIMISITESFESLTISEEPVINFTKAIIQSKLLENQSMIMSFLLFIEKASPYLPSNKEVFHSTMSLLLNIMQQDKFYEELSAHIMYSINMFTKNADIEVFQLICQYFKEKYNNFTKETAINLAQTLCCTISPNNIKQKIDEELIDIDQKDKQLNQISVNELKKYYDLIMAPATERIKLLLSYFASNEYTTTNQSQQQHVIAEIIKSYSVHYRILFQSYTINKELHFQLFTQHFKDTYQTTNIIFTLLCNCQEIITELSIIYIKTVDHLQEKSIVFFNELNQLMLTALSKNYQNYRCLIVLKSLYSYYAQENNEVVKQLFFSLCRDQSINIMKNNTDQGDMLKLFSEFFYYVFRKLNLSNGIEQKLTILYDTITIFIEGMNAFKDQSIQKHLIRALSCFIDHDSLPPQVIKEKYSLCVNTIFMAIDSFDSNTITEFHFFVGNALSYDKMLFLSTIESIFTTNELFKRLFSKQHCMVIFDYFNLFYDDDSKMKRITTEIVSIKQGKSRTEDLKFYGIEIARKKVLNK